MCCDGGAPYSGGFCVEGEDVADEDWLVEFDAFESDGCVLVVALAERFDEGCLVDE